MWERKKHTGGRANPISNKAAYSLAWLIAKAQEGFANIMGKLFGKMNVKATKIVVGFIAIMAGGFSLFILLDAIVRPGESLPQVNVYVVRVPNHFTKTGENEITTNAYVDEETHQTITVFKRYMDSLKMSNARQYDSILKVRPQLLDSVLWLENLYYLQKQKAYEK